MQVFQTFAGQIHRNTLILSGIERIEGKAGCFSRTWLADILNAQIFAYTRLRAKYSISSIFVTTVIL